MNQVRRSDAVQPIELGCAAFFGGFYMEEIVVYVHGKDGSAQEAEHYKALFPNCEVIGFDYHAQSPWEATEEFSGFLRQCGNAAGSSHWWQIALVRFYLCPR